MTPPCGIDLIWKPYGIPTPIAEYKFCPTRRWRADYAWIDEKVIVEIDGGIWTRGRHSRGYGMRKDNEKLNEAQKLGWRVFRFEPIQLRNGEAQTFLKEVLK